MTYEQFENEIVDISKAMQHWTATIDSNDFAGVSADLKKIKDRINALWTNCNLCFHVRMLKDVVSELPQYLWDGQDLTAKAGGFYIGSSNKLGAMTIRTKDGSILGVKPGEFEIIEPAKLLPPTVAEQPKQPEVLKAAATEAAIAAYGQQITNVFYNLSVSITDADETARKEAHERAEKGIEVARQLMVEAKILIAGMNTSVE